MSGPARDLWIEILDEIREAVGYPGRVPQGTCGLKSFSSGWLMSAPKSGPARDLWIEIRPSRCTERFRPVGSRKGPVD